jgi:hypothetical protein
MANRKTLTDGAGPVGGERTIAIPGAWTLSARTAVMSKDASMVAIEVQREAPDGRVTMRLYLTASEGEALRGILGNAIDGVWRDSGDPAALRKAERKAERAELLLAAQRLAKLAKGGEPVPTEFLSDFGAALVGVFSGDEIESELVDMLRSTALALQLVIAQPPQPGFEEDAARAVVKAALECVARAGG